MFTGDAMGIDIESLAQTDGVFAAWMEKEWLPSRGEHAAAGHTPLHVAARGGNSAAVWSLLKAGADTRARDARGMLPIHHSYGEEDLLLLLAADPVSATEVDAAGRVPKRNGGLVFKNYSEFIEARVATMTADAAVRQVLATERMAAAQEMAAEAQGRVADSMEQGRRAALAARLGRGFLNARDVSVLTMVATGDMYPEDASEVLATPSAKQVPARPSGGDLSLAEEGMDRLEAGAGLFLERSPVLSEKPARRPS